MTGLLSLLNPGWLLIAVGLVALFLPMRRHFARIRRMASRSR